MRNLPSDLGSIMTWYRDLKVLIIDDEFAADNASGRALAAIAHELGDKRGISVLSAATCEEGWQLVLRDPDIGCIMLDWDASGAAGRDDAERLISAVVARSHNMPLLLASERHATESVHVHLLRHVSGYLWKTEDTPNFIAGRIEQALETYAETLLPPMFRELARYTGEYKYAWHTPGHMGGVAFLRSPAGRRFFRYFGENVFRSDLSISVPELGSLLDHSAAIGEAEHNAARTFGADHTYFVVNGTSTANKMVWSGRIVPGDVVLVDRNCHKSIQHALILTGAIPVYLVPKRNHYGIIGAIPSEQFEAKSIQRKLAESPLVDSHAPARIALAVVTNSTYDGICYDAGAIVERLGPQVENLHFDEAWFAYAAFHELYAGRYGMHESVTENVDEPVVWVTQSTHKMLAAFSQASMIHLRDRHVPESARVDHERFNEAFMMHTSTSPQYGIIASLDVAARMMQHGGGRVMMQDAIEEAIGFRKEMVRVGSELIDEPGDSWWFSVLQPDAVARCPVASSNATLEQATTTLEDDLSTTQRLWHLNSGEPWHGFADVGDGFAMLDPTKVQILTPGIAPDGSFETIGIPAAIVSRYLRTRGIVVEKTDVYSFLMLFSIGLTKGKSGTLITELLRFKDLYDADAALDEVLPDLARDMADYSDMSLRTLASRMHAFYRSHDAMRIAREVFSCLPEPAMIPALAYQRRVRGAVERIGLAELDGRISAAAVLPYPPGIPIIMPGERFDRRKSPRVLDFLELFESFHNSFPGFEHEAHGVTVERDRGSGKVRYLLDCLSESRSSS